MFEPLAPLSLPIVVALFGACIVPDYRPGGRRADTRSAPTAATQDDVQADQLTVESCPTGYERRGETCDDIDACAASPCDAQATCLNVPGGFECLCPPGYESDGTHCSACGAATADGLQVYLTFEPGEPGEAGDSGDSGTSGTRVIDTSGNHHDGTSSHLTFVPGKLGSGAAFDGSLSEITFGSHAKVDRSRTICAWLKPDASLGLGQPIVVSEANGESDKQPQASDVDRFGVSASTSPTNPEMCGSNARSSAYVETLDCAVAAPLIAPSAWSFVCFAWTESEQALRVYANGSATSFAKTELGATTLADLTIGANPFGGESTRASLAGVLDEVAIWTRALSQDEMDVLYNNGVGCRIR